MAWNNFTKIFQNLFSQVFSGSSELPNDRCLRSETITRFIFSKSHFAKSNNRVKPRAFEPNKNRETSVFRIDHLDMRSVWQIYTDHVKPNNTRTLYGRADVKAEIIFNANLDILPSEPPPRHADIINWPDDKNTMMSQAQQIAAESSLVLED